MVKPRTFLAHTHPHLREQFLYALNKDGNVDEAVTFNMLASSTNRKCAWKCLKTNCKRNCEHIFIATVNNRASKKRNCPKCSGRKVCPCNSLAGKFPDILKEWDYERNAGVNPEEISPKSSLILHWKCITYNGCECHRWMASIHNRTGGSTGCPYCCHAQKSICEHKNAATEYPDLIPEWHTEKNGEMELSRFSPYSNHYVWWQCTRCSHAWKTMINSRTGTHSSNCPRCKESKMETAMVKVLEYLKTVGVVQSFEREWRMRGTRFRADFRVTFIHDNIIIVIETDGQQHFQPRSFGSGQSPLEMLERTKKWDQQKKEWCMKNKIPLLRLSYLVKFEHFQEEVLEFLEQVKKSPSTETLFKLVGNP